MDAFTTPETAPDDALRNAVPVPAEACTPVSEPDYLRRVYWWAYLHPRAIRVFERQWLVNLILWGNYKALRDAALAELAGAREGRVLQLACVYGDFSRKLAACLAGDGSLSVVDVAQIQLDNLHRKLGAAESVTLHRQNSAALTFGDGSFDTAVAFFLLHEQPEDVRIRTLREAIRVVRPGGKLVIVDYHRPNTRHPLRPVMPLIFRTLEPFAMDLWRTDVRTWLPSDRRCDIAKETFFGGLYQKITVVPH
ncbi:MAG: rhodoquinone biosynthesis methyltransferase RquA [Alphaproteobacteria bacterium]